MIEIEVKVLEVDASAVQKRLVSFGAKKVFEGEVEWSVYDLPDKRFSRNDVLIRLRKLGDKTQLTVKKLLNTEGAKVADETEVETTDFQSTDKILRSLGLLPKRGYPLHKHSISYVLDDTHFEIDTFPDIPPFLEIEAPSKEGIYAFVEKLGLSAHAVKPWGTREVFAHYRK